MKVQTKQQAIDAMHKDAYIMELLKRRCFNIPLKTPIEDA